ncbi:MAG: hypothetical protein DKM50_05630 [Candidatus Margulisiibacteriota bacterium]|nr:MAG: hypothetical protein A2X42_07595 [Candidatus Margulisbacteria bacterium GWF2_38_17]PZM80190.1 MAG: hypothetical protein DKM50_05630 [Candidatus Margulisiibacteriota bacterium]
MKIANILILLISFGLFQTSANAIVDQCKPSALIQIGSGIAVSENDVLAGSLIAIGSPVRIDGIIKGNVIAFGDSIAVNNEVAKDIIVLGGSVNVSANARVLGAIMCIGGDAVIEPGAKVSGPVRTGGAGIYTAGQLFAALNPFFSKLHKEFTRETFKIINLLLIVGKVIFWSLLFFVGILLVLIVPKNIKNIEKTIFRKPIFLFLIGLFMLIVTGLLSLFLFFTLAGILIIPFLVCFVLFFTFLGAILTIKRILEFFLNRLNIYSVVDIVMFLIAFIFLCIFFNFKYLEIIGIPIMAFTGIVGLGGIIYTGFGYRRSQNL